MLISDYRVNNPLPPEKHAVDGGISNPLLLCGMVYIGKTIQRLETRLKEHRDACKRAQTGKSAIVEHAWRNGHSIRWDDVVVLDHAKRHRELLLKEALHICTTARGKNFNRNHGTELHDHWITLVRAKTTLSINTD